MEQSAAIDFLQGPVHGGAPLSQPARHEATIRHAIHMIRDATASRCSQRFAYELVTVLEMQLIKGWDYFVHFSFCGNVLKEAFCLLKGHVVNVFQHSGFRSA